MSGLIVIIFLSVSMVALNAIVAPSLSVSLRIIRASTLVSVSVVLFVSCFLMASLKVNVILVDTETGLSRSFGSNTIVGAIVSSAVKVAELSVIKFPYKSSTDASILTKITCSLEKSLVGFIVIYDAVRKIC